MEGGSSKANLIRKESKKGIQLPPELPFSFFTKSTTMDVLDLITDKEKIVLSLLKQIDNQDKAVEGLSKLIEGDSSDEFKMKTLLQVVRNQAATIKRLSLVSLVYVQGSNFNVDSATLAAKMGRGNEALRAMLNKKMKS